MAWCNYRRISTISVQPLQRSDTGRMATIADRLADVLDLGDAHGEIEDLGCCFDLLRHGLPPQAKVTFAMMLTFRSVTQPV